jgi:hypothetical protein
MKVDGEGMKKKRTYKKRSRGIVLKVSSVAKLLKTPLYEIQRNANHFGLTTTETVKRMLRDRDIT